MVEILVLHKRSLLAEGVESLLKREHLRVIGMDIEDPEAMERVGSLSPEAVLVLDTREAESYPWINIPQVLQQNPHAIVIALDSQDNKVEIFRKEERVIGKLADLVDILRKLSDGL